MCELFLLQLRAPLVELELEITQKVADHEFAVVDPALTPFSFADVHRAWRAADAGVQVELAMLRDDLVWARVFDVDAPQLAAYRAEREAPGAFDFFSVLRVPALVIALFLAAHAKRSGRVDTVGTMRLAGAIFVIVLAVTLLTGNHSADPAAEGSLWLRGMARGLLVSVQYALFYAGLEPHVRRIWPEIMISWSRFLRGRFGDAAVGYSLVVGLAVGAAAAASVFISRVSYEWFGSGPAYPMLIRDRSMEVLHGGGFPIGALLEIVAQYTDISMVLALTLVVFRYVLRTRVRAGVALGVLFFAGWSFSLPGFNPLAHGLLALESVAMVLALARGGVLSGVAALFAFRVLTVFPLKTDFDHWLGSATALGVGTLFAIAGWGAWCAMRPRAGAV